MESKPIEEQAGEGFKQSKSFFESEAAKLRTGRAYPGLLDQVMVEAYETKVPLRQVASISVPSADSLQVTPFDTKNLAPIVAAIQADQQLNLNPTDNGQVVYVPIPPLTAERRQQLIKALNQKKEEAYIRLRQIRHKAIKAIKDADSLSESAAKQSEVRIDKMMQDCRVEIETMSQRKEAEIATV